MTGFSFHERMAGQATRTGERPRPFSFAIHARAPRLLLPWRTVFARVRGTVDLDGLASGAPCTGWLELSPVRRRMMRYVIDFRAEDGRAFRFDGRKRITPWWLPSWTILRGRLQLLDPEPDPDWARVEVRFSLRRQLPALLAGMRPWRPYRAAAAETLMAPRWRGQPGRLEVWYATLTDPGSGEGVWIHHELLAPRDGTPARRQGWAAVFPPGGPPTVERFAGHAAVPGPEEGVPVFAANGVTVRGGTLRGAAGSLRWDLHYRGTGPPLFTFPAWAWERELLPAAQIVPLPTARFSGTVHVGRRTLELADAPGALARIYGQGNAERWGWLHAELGGGDVVEIVTAVSRRPVLRRLAPMSFLALRLDGRDWPRRRLLAALVLDAELDPPHGFTVRGALGSRRLRADVRLDPTATLTLQYDETEGVGPRCANSERASLELVLERRTDTGRWESEREWTLPDRAHAEVGWRE